MIQKEIDREIFKKALKELLDKDLQAKTSGTKESERAGKMLWEIYDRLLKEKKTNNKTDSNTV
ncbi:MAG: hypothetical protein JW922_08615 [Paludibacteraceae bacterium]|nr:hypothetical protein [Paludibacteraceae bacterium]